MGSSRKSKSTRAKSARPHQRRPRSRIHRKAINRTSAKVREIPTGVGNEIENQRDVLVTVITLLHCLHVVLEHQEDHAADQELNPRIEAAIKWASLPDITAMLLDRTHAVLDALDSVNLIEASKAFKP
jgi:hypothetical protein